MELIDSSVTADIIWDRAIPYLQELGICDTMATVEIMDGENVGLEITGGEAPAAAYSWCYWDAQDVATSTKTIIAVGYPDWDQWNTYLQGWTEVGEGLYPSLVLLHELYHIQQCLVTGEIVGDENWTVDPDEYEADSYALEHLEELRAAPIIVFMN